MIKITAGSGACQLCGKIAELRPYGPEGRFICFACGMKDEPATAARMATLWAAGNVVLDASDPQQPEPGITRFDPAAARKE